MVPANAMSSSIFDIFKIGIGPSSSHTVGPMRAAARFAAALAADTAEVHQLSVELFGSLALTGRGHCTDTAILLGLEGHLPEEIDPDAIAPIMDRIRSEGRASRSNISPWSFGPSVIVYSLARARICSSLKPMSSSIRKAT